MSRRFQEVVRKGLAACSSSGLDVEQCFCSGWYPGQMSMALPLEISVVNMGPPPFKNIIRRRKTRANLKEEMITTGMRSSQAK
jgi:hypothetical protein